MPANLLRYRIMALFRSLALMLVTFACVTPVAAEIATLFTTPRERQIIDANRYKTDEIQEPREIEEPEPEIVVTVKTRQVSKSFFISGITVSNNGPHTVWINNEAYLDGEHLEDESHVKVLVGDDIRVRITTPDGKIYHGVSGETLELSYTAPVEN